MNRTRRRHRQRVLAAHPRRLASPARLESKTYRVVCVSLPVALAEFCDQMVLVLRDGGIRKVSRSFVVQTAINEWRAAECPILKS